jgi:DNA-directed RNA polymerase specialized sigma subunit
MSKLSPQEQLLLRLRFEQDLTLQEIARIAGLKDAQSADRNIRALLERVRAGMTGFSGRVSGNAKAASV